ncbi:MAG: hypothetical protein A2622_13390 [Bdellovibrionales bacterium RIFCSPHIGHO2_01_FULL_40_29]|nr:MAG: hypothetical protein A2622_13390 [Bdellovibrionales bacterium RIFCSPHIGHO2_01_FULL_40_29]OFZ34326.1 MAG: hypothetical protein A3D17_04560 [Bdellovibrionales bacterium RIFCSPHIGHO2_02_FULL_40_15]
MKFLLLSSLGLVLMSCGQMPVKTAPDLSVTSEAPTIDYQSIQRLLGLDKSVNSLGYSEKYFNTCKVGYGFSETENCQNRYFVVVHFKLMCRDSEGTVSNQVVEDDLMPVSNQPLKWQIQNLNGSMQTDSSGNGQILAISARPLRKERLRVSTSKDFMLMRAGDIQRLIVPRTWCE